MFAKNENSGSMLQGINDLTFIQFGNPDHFRKRVILFSDTLFEKPEHDVSQAATACQVASCMNVPQNQYRGYNQSNE